MNIGQSSEVHDICMGQGLDSWDAQECPQFLSEVPCRSNPDLENQKIQVCAFLVTISKFTPCRLLVEPPQHEIQALMKSAARAALSTCIFDAG